MTQRTLIPIFLVGLPIGLAVSVVAALYLYYNPLDIPLPRRAQREDVRRFLRHSPNEQDLREYRRILTTELSAQALPASSRRSARASWIASTLGPSNLGFTVRSLEPDNSNAPDNSEQPDPQTAAGLPERSLLIEIPGSRLKNEAIVVATGYQSDAQGVQEMDDDTATATVMSLAGAFTGAPQRRTLIIAFLASESADHIGRSPLDAVVHDVKLRSLTLRGIIDLRVARPAAPAPVPRAHAVALAPRDAQPWTAEVREAFAPRRPSGLALEFIDASDAPAPAASLAGWRNPPAPYVLLWLTPAAASDEASPLALAQSLEGVLQALANQ